MNIFMQRVLLLHVPATPYQMDAHEDDEHKVIIIQKPALSLLNKCQGNANMQNPVTAWRCDFIAYNSLVGLIQISGIAKEISNN